MRLINISGGLGNQLFQLCIFNYLQNKGYKVKLNLAFYKDQNKFIYRLFRLYRKIPERKFYFYDVFSKNIISEKSLRELIFSKFYFLNFFQAIIYSIIPFKYFIRLFNITIINENNFMNSNFIVKNKLNIYDGYWQKKEFVVNHNQFIFNTLKSINSSFVSSKIKMNCITIHVRRGDQATSSSSSLYTLLDKSYFQAGISFLREKDNSLNKVFICSDDINWCKKNLTEFSNISQVFYSEATSMFDDFGYMFNSKNLILSNSTFCWWAAFLSDNANVVIPKNWYSLYPHSFIDEFKNFTKI